MLNRLPGKPWRTPLPSRSDRPLSPGLSGRRSGIAPMPAVQLRTRALAPLPGGPAILLPTRRRLDTPLITNYEDVAEFASAPGNPPSGSLRLYAKTDHSLHALSSAGVDSALGGASAAGLVLLTSGTVSAAATLDIVLTSYTAYRSLLFDLQSFVPVTDDVELWMQVSTNGGSTYDSGAANYLWSLNMSFSTFASPVIYRSAGDTKIVLAGNTTVNESVSNVAAEGGVGASIIIRDQTNTGKWPHVDSKAAYLMGTGGIAAVVGASARVTAQDTDAVRFLFESGNISSGKYAVYGYA